MGIFGHGFDGETADALQCGTAQHGTRAAEERRVPHVIAILDQAVEQLAFIGATAERTQVALERVGREEMVRRLHQRQLRVLEEPAHCHLQEGAHRHVVAVENGDQLAVGHAQRMVEVASLGVLVVRPHDVAHPHFVGERTERLAPAVVEDIDAQALARPVQAQGGQHRGAHHRQVFVVGGDHQVDGRPVRRICRQVRRLALQWPAGLDVAQDQHEPRIGFCRQQDHPAHKARGVVPVQGRGVAPP
ncbi:hypothetical protein D3C75_586530 [compost metagenome]